MGKGDQGKELEAACKKYLDEYTRRPENYYHRFPDARTGRGRIGKQPADYIVWRKGKPDILLDPKELKKGQRINIKSRLSQSQTMTRIAMTDVVESFFIVHQTTDNLYYIIPNTYVGACIGNGEKGITITNFTAFKSLNEVLDKILGEC